MNIKILDKLCCPACKGKLIVKSFFEVHRGLFKDKAKQHEITSSESQKRENIIKQGVLICSTCKKWFPIYSYVPIMLLFKTHFHKRFAEKYSEQLKTLSDYDMPNEKAKSGELSVQETFTEEWDIVNVQDSELSFTYTLEDLIMLNKKVWLKWIDSSPEEIITILNIGCGLGWEAMALKEVVSHAEIFAVDLNLALLKSGEAFKSKSNIHLIISSLFDIPFTKSSFDLVYSQGVIHHTFSAYEALKSIASYVRHNGYLFIWIYGLDDHLIYKGFFGIIKRLMYLIERVARPIISRSPKTLRDIFFHITALITYPLDKKRVRHKDKWGLKDTNHGLRDWLSPRYAHRHSYNEVFEWLEDLGFKIIDVQSPSTYRKLFKKRLWGVGLTGKKV